MVVVSRIASSGTGVHFRKRSLPECLQRIPVWQGGFYLSAFAYRRDAEVGNWWKCVFVTFDDSDEQKAWARSEHQKLVDALEDKQNEFFATRKKANDEHMARVQRIETAVREKRSENRKPNTANRDARKALFLRRANEDLPEIPSTFVRTTKAFKAATRIFRDAGTERGWQTLKPKIQKEWEEAAQKESSPSPALLDRSAESDDGGDMLQPTTHPNLGQHRGPGLLQRTTASYPGPDLYGLGTSHLPDLSSISLAYRNLSHMPQIPTFGGMYSGNSNNRNLSHSAYLAAAYALPQPGYPNNTASASYPHNAQHHYQQLLEGTHPYHNNRAVQHHGQQHATRPMSIPSLLQDNPQMMRFSHHPHHPRSYMG